MPPAVTAAAFTLLVVAVLVGRVGASRADAPRFVDSVPWLSWLLLTGLALNVFAALLAGSLLVLSVSLPSATEQAARLKSVRPEWMLPPCTRALHQPSGHA
jgi:hypothetical protein